MPPLHNRPVIINGRRFNSQKEAAEHFGCHPNSISRRVAKHGLCFDWSGPTPGGGRKQPLEYEGQLYPSVAAAARAAGLPYNIFYNAFVRDVK